MDPARGARWDDSAGQMVNGQTLQCKALRQEGDDMNARQNTTRTRTDPKVQSATAPLQRANTLPNANLPQPEQQKDRKQEPIQFREEMLGKKESELDTPPPYPGP